MRSNQTTRNSKKSGHLFIKYKNFTNRNSGNSIRRENVMNKSIIWVPTIKAGLGWREEISVLHWLAACGKTLSLLPQNKIEGLNDLAPGGKKSRKTVDEMRKADAHACGSSSPKSNGGGVSWEWGWMLIGERLGLGGEGGIGCWGDGAWGDVPPETGAKASLDLARFGFRWDILKWKC